MHRALAVGAENPTHPFGVVIVHRTTGDVLAEGRNRTCSNPILHAEIDAIHRCCSLAFPPPWEEIDLYATAEPCPMCQSAICYAGIRSVYFGSSSAFLGLRGWRQFELSAEVVSRSATWSRCSIVGAVLENECNALFEKARPVSPSLEVGGDRS